MERIETFLSVLDTRHREALLWFAERAGEEHPWPQPLYSAEGETLLATKAKGIYKPQWSDYALSVRQSLGGQYPDLDPIVHSDGTWSFPYFQEKHDPDVRDDEYTNRALMNCWRDRVPVGVFRQTREKPNPRYRILGIALVADWIEGYFFLEGFARDGHGRGVGPYAELDWLSKRQQIAAQEGGEFDSTGILDARERTIAQIIRRRGQPTFRKELLLAYEYKCAISNCDAPEALEACHIYPYRGVETNHISNGILLRSDLHTLFDLGLIVVDSKTTRIVVAKAIASTTYGCLAEVVLRQPASASQRPSRQALEAHRAWAGF